MKRGSRRAYLACRILTVVSLICVGFFLPSVFFGGYDQDEPLVRPSQIKQIFSVAPNKASTGASAAGGSAGIVEKSQELRKDNVFSTHGALAIDTAGSSFSSSSSAASGSTTTGASPLELFSVVKLLFGETVPNPKYFDDFDGQVKRSLMPILKHLSAIERKNGIVEQLDKRSERSADYFIDTIQKGGVRFLLSELGATCYAECRSRGTQCSRDWFLLFNQCKLMESLFPDSVECTNEFFGRDLPAYRPSTNSILLNSEGISWLPSCGASHDLTRRICGCETNQNNEAPMTFHTVYNLQSSPYFEWQSRYSYYWFKKSGMVGNYTRLLSADKPDHLVDEVPTFTSPGWKSIEDPYSPYNKPLSMLNWLNSVDIKEDIIILLDPDCFVVSPLDIPVREGAPVAQQGYYMFKDSERNSIEMQICKHYCPTCAHFDSVAVPIIMHKNDAKKIVPLWLEYIKKIRADRATWPIDWNDPKRAGNALSWVAEMYAYVLATSELQIRHDIWNLQAVPGVDKLLRRPVIHYHTTIKIGEKSWMKRLNNAHKQIVWPVPEGTDEVISKLMQGLYEADRDLPPLSHQWPDGWEYLRNED